MAKVRVKVKVSMPFLPRDGAVAGESLSKWLNGLSA